jgi:hypothetical protein
VSFSPISVHIFALRFDATRRRSTVEKTGRVAQWHKALQGQNEQIPLISVDLLANPEIVAVLTRLPRQSHAFSVHFDQIIQKRRELFPQKFLVINNPLGAELCGSKKFLLTLQQW